MKKLAALLVVLVGVGAVFAFGTWVGWRSAGAGSRPTTERTIVAYTCPMHPAYRSDRPGACPSCGMRLEPVYGDGSGGDKDAPADASRLLKISAERQQSIGVKVGRVEETAGRQTIRTVGRLVPDETRVYRVLAGADGWITDVSDTPTGSIVRKSQRLGAYYTPDLLQALQRYIIAQPTTDGVGRANAPFAVQTTYQQAIDGLRALGMSEEQIAEIAKTRQLEQKIWIIAPAPGFVVARNVSSGQRFGTGDELYRIADLSRIWVLADVFGRQADYIKPGTVARVVVAERDRVYSAKVSTAQALFDETSRTLKVRLELDNADYALKPGMFVDVDFEAAVPQAVTVPADAIVDSGLRKMVFVDRGNGYFEPRRVETGWRVGGRVQILKGLMVGERIVVEGTFLIDSESRMKAVAAGISGAPAADPVCGMDVDEQKAGAAGRTTAHDGHTYYFCSDECKQKFEKEPGKYIK
jgi:membrane fusion protein, copper/silver efflux system